MKFVKMKSSFAGMVNMPAGSIQEMHDVEDDRMVTLGHAEYVTTEKKAEKREKRTRKSKESR